MKNSLRSLALGAAVAVGSMAFAQQPFSITQNFVAKYGADVIGVTPSAEVRTGAGFNGKLYAVDKANHRIVAFDGTGMTVVREDLPETWEQKVVEGVPQVDEEGNPVMQRTGTVGTALAIDDAGNMLFTWGWPNATMSKHFYIAPADGSAIIDLGETAPYAGLDAGEFTPARTDNLGRIVGDIMSEEGGILYVATTGMYKAGGLHIANGAYVEDTFEYSADAMTYAAEGQSIAVPYYNTIEEQLAADPIYNAYYLIPRNAPFQTFYNGEVEVIARPDKVDGEFNYCSNPGGDVINYNGSIYYIQPCHDGDTAGGAYKPGFMIYDEAQNLLFQEKFADLAASGGYGNGGAINVRKVDDYTFDVYVFQHNKADNKIIVAYYTVEFPAPAEPGSIYLVGAPSGWVAPSEDSAAHYEAWKLTETAAETGVYTGTFTIPAGKALFRFYSELTGWDAGASLGYEDSERNVDCAFTDNAFTGPIVAGKANYSFPAWEGGVMDITVDLNAGTVSIAATPMFIAPDLYVRGEFNSWDATEETLMSKVQNSAESYKYSITLPTLAGQFKLSTADWTTSFGGPIATTLEISEAGEYDVFENGGNLVFNIADTKDIVIELVITRNFSIEASKLTISWTSGVADLVVDQEAARFFNLQGIEVPADQLTTGVYVKLQGSKATKVTVK